MKTAKKLKVLVAMSGGVDSSVAALLMKQKGYEVVGAFMKNWSDTKTLRGECDWKAERRHALKIASKLNIPLITLDFESQYKKLVIKEMFALYKKGITPNPDVDCNQKIKFPLLIKAAKKIKADFIVTGHFARIKKSKGKHKLLRAKDETKDQSYFLYRLSQNDLKHSLFPIGELTKPEVRKIAKENKFENHDKKSTTGICFIGKVNMKDFLKQKIKPKKGKILDPKGNKIGEHDGVYYYTINQRLGERYGITLDKSSQMARWYVAKKDIKKNILIAAPRGHKILLRQEIKLTQPHWITESPLNKKTNVKVHSRIRQVGELLPSTLMKKNGKLSVKLNKQITGISDGQAIVLYKGKECLGGGVISS